MSESSAQKPIRDYKDLHVWQKGMELARRIYPLTSRFPSEGTDVEDIFRLVADVQKMLKRSRHSLTPNP